MAFADPQIVTINGVAKTLHRVTTGNYSAVYGTEDGDVQLSASHQFNGKRTRRVIRIDDKKIASDPLLSVNAEFSVGAYIVVDQPKVGFTAAEIKKIVTGLLDLVTDDDGALLAQFLGSES